MISCLHCKATLSFAQFGAHNCSNYRNSIRHLAARNAKAAANMRRNARKARRLALTNATPTTEIALNELIEYASM